MSEDARKPIVFVSHSADERAVAFVLQKHLRIAFPDAEVFVASDDVSIPAGKRWLEHIVARLKESRILLSLISSASQARSWINFEYGFAEGAKVEVVPVAIDNLPVGAIQFPLGGSHAKSIDDIDRLVEIVGKALRQNPIQVNICEYHDEIDKAELELIRRDLELHPFLNNRGNVLCFELENVGNVDLEMLMVEVYVPASFAVVLRRGITIEMDSDAVQLDGRSYGWYACYSPRGAYRHVSPMLRPIVTPGMGRVALDDFHIQIREPTFDDRNAEIHYQAHAISHRNTRKSVLYSNLEIRSLLNVNAHYAFGHHNQT